MQVHTAHSLSRALGRKVEKAITKKSKSELPFQPAGRRPVAKGDDGTPSRHRIVEQPASLVLLFNCHNAAFEVTKWTGDTPFEKLPGESQFDMISKTSKKRIGMVRLAKELVMPLSASDCLWLPLIACRCASPKSSACPSSSASTSQTSGCSPRSTASSTTAGRATA